MRNKIAGLVILGIDVLIGFIIFIFNRALTTIVETSCSHGSSCPMWGTIRAQTTVSIGIMAFIALIGLYFVFFGEEVRIITRIKKVREQLEPKKFTKENYENIMKALSPDEKMVLEKVIESEGTVFQSALIEKTGLTKVKITRILDRLEGKDIVERKRRGMTNVIILKHK
ncbi:MAG: hypothetical protein V1866_02115 [archaeon]